MDELDLLVTRKQTVIYNFFDWPNRRHSRLVVVAVANTMDLPERMLTHRCVPARKRASAREERTWALTMRAAGHGPPMHWPGAVPSIASRLGLNRITFEAYTHRQLIEILSARLHDIDGARATPSVSMGPAGSAL